MTARDGVGEVALSRNEYDSDEMTADDVVNLVLFGVLLSTCEREYGGLDQALQPGRLAVFGSRKRMRALAIRRGRAYNLRATEAASRAMDLGRPGGRRCWCVGSQAPAP